MRNRKIRLRIFIIALASLVVVLPGSFYIYTLDYYRADEYAIETFASEQTHIKTRENLTVIYPDKQLDRNIGFIFYPGGKVEATAYIPLLEKLAQGGLTCVLIKMPLNLAVFDVNAAEEVYAQFPEIQSWYLAGHSLGGAMASSYAGEFSEKIDGLILLGAYPVNDADIPTIAVYGSEDIKLDLTQLEGMANQVEIIGGNHAYFGNYGEQEGDGIAAITREEQQAQTVEAILNFIK